jgi:hypothetical protein
MICDITIKPDGVCTVAIGPCNEDKEQSHINFSSEALSTLKAEDLVKLAKLVTAIAAEPASKDEATAEPALPSTNGSSKLAPKVETKVPETSSQELASPSTNGSSRPASKTRGSGSAKTKAPAGPAAVAKEPAEYNVQLFDPDDGTKASAGAGAPPVEVVAQAPSPLGVVESEAGIGAPPVEVVAQAPGPVADEDGGRPVPVPALSDNDDEPDEVAAMSISDDGGYGDDEPDEVAAMSISDDEGYRYDEEEPF